MDNLKEEGQSIIMLTVILAILVVVLSVGLVCLIRSPKDTEGNKISQEFTKSQDELGNSNFSEKEDNANDRYKIFADNLKKEVSRYGNNANFQIISGDGIKPYSVKLLANGNISVHFEDEETEQKYGTDSLVQKVIAFNIVEVGNGGLHTLYFINEDGTVGSADIEVAVGMNEDIKIKSKIGNLKNIVAIISGAGDLETSGAAIPFFVDIDGKINLEV